MDRNSRIFATMFVWFFGLMATVIVATSYSAASYMAAPIIVAVLMAMGFIWNWGRLPMTGGKSNTEAAQGKAKRHSRVDDMLADLDDRDLLELRRRLMDAEEDMAEEVYLTEEGELVRRR